MRRTLLSLALLLAACGPAAPAHEAAKVPPPPIATVEPQVVTVEPPPPPVAPNDETHPVEPPKPAPESASVVTPDSPISEAALAGMRAAFRRCFAKALQSDPALRASPKLSIDFDAAGKVAQVNIDGLSSAPLKSCLERAVRQLLSLPKGPATIRIPISVDAQGGG